MRYLVGATKDNRLVFADVENRKDYFSVCFDTVRPFNKDDVDLEEYVENLYDRSDIGDTEFVDLLERYDCKPSELVDCILEDFGDDPRNYLDCSLYDGESLVNGDTWYFESDSCGQCDTRDEMDVYINKEAYDEIIRCWDNYHLKPIPSEELEKLNKAVELLLCVNEEEWIENYIDEMFY